MAIAAILLIAATACSAGHYSLAFVRTAGNDEGHGIAVMEVHVFNEFGKPVSGVTCHFSGPLGDKIAFTDYRGYAEYGFQFAGSPATVYCTHGSGATSDVTVPLYNHDAHRLYEIGFLYKTSSANPGVFDTSWCGDPNSATHAASTRSLTFNTPVCTDYYSDTRDLDTSAYAEFGNTFVATADRAVAMRAHLTKGFATRFRWSAQILEGGPTGPPMGPKKILPNEYIEGDNKYVLNYAVDECVLKPGNTYFVKFSTSDGTLVNTYECLNDVYAYGILYRDQTPVPGRELQAWVCAMSSGNTNVGAVTGTVVGPSGQPIPEAAVVLNPGERRLLTGGAGTYKCYNIAPGTYSMTASAPGYQPSTATGRVVFVGGSLETDFQLQPDAGTIDVQTTSGGTVVPGAQDVPFNMTVANSGGGDIYVHTAGLSFWNGAVNCDSFFDVTASPTNPTIVRGSGASVFDFTVDVHPDAPAGNYTVQGGLEGDVNMRANGSFEIDDYLPNYTGPSQWDWYSDDPPSVARLSYEHQVTYETLTSMPASTKKVVVSWIGKWSSTGGSNKKQGLRVYWPNATGVAWRTQLNINCNSSLRTMTIGLGSGGTCQFEFNKYYRIDATCTDNGATGNVQYIITPLEGQSGGGTINATAATSTSATYTVKWGKMSDSGTEEMSCREIHLWYEDSGGSILNEHHWLATNGLLPTQDGWSMDSSGNHAMLPGAPWSSDTHFFINTSDKIEGAKALDVWFSPSGSDRQLYLSSGTGGGVLQRVPVEPSATYTLSYWYKMITYGGAGNYQLRTIWEEYDQSGLRYFQVGTDPPFHWNEIEPFSGGWRQASYTFTTTQYTRTAEVRLHLWKPGVSAAAAVVRLDDVRLLGPNPYCDTDADSPGALRVAYQASSLGDAKSKPDGTAVTLTGVACTGYPVDQTTRFCIEETDRSSGILVDKTGGSGDLSVLEDELITVTGVLDTNADGERMLTLPSVTSRVSQAAPDAVGMPGRSLGGGPDGFTPGVEGGVGRNNVGLLVTVWGSVNNAGPGCFYVDDGSSLSDGVGAGIKVISGSVPQQGGATYALVTGFSSVEKSGGKSYRVVRPRRASDIVWL